MYSDYHVHSNYSNDSKSTIENICITAIKKRMHTVCITDHMDAVYPQRMNEPCEIDKFFCEFEKVRKKYCNQINLIPGFEFSEPYKNIKAFERAKKYPFEYRMCSVHHCAMGKFPSPPSINAYRAVHEFLENVKETVALDGIDAIGHIDLIRRYYGIFPYIRDELCEILDLIIQKGIWLEVNTSCLPREEEYIKIDYLEEYKKLGGNKIVLGSDAHTLTDIGRNFTKIKINGVQIKV